MDSKNTGLLLKLLLVCFGFLILNRIISILAYLSTGDMLFAVALSINLIISLILAYYCFKVNRTALVVTMAYAMLGIRAFSDVFSIFSGSDDVFKVIYALALIVQAGLIIIPILILSKVDDTSIMKKFKELEEAPGLTKAFMKFTAITGGIAICLYLLVFAALAYGRFDPLTNQLTWVLAVAFPAVFLLGYRSTMRGSYFGLMLTNLMLPILYFGSMTVLASFRLIPGMSEGGPLAAISMLFGLLMLFLPLTAILVALIVLEIKLITPQEKSA